MMAAKKPKKKKAGDVVDYSTLTSTGAPKRAIKRPPVAAPPVAAPAASPPTDPLAPMNMAQMQDQATKVAMGQVQPQLNIINQNQQQAQSAHDTRTGQVNNWAQWQQGNLNSAFEDTRNALNNLVTLQGGVDQSAQDTLAAALRSGGGSTDQAASMLGVASPTDLNPGLGAGGASARSLELGVGSGAGALLGLEGANRSLGSVGQAQNQETERQRWNAENKGFLDQKQGLSSSIPGLVATSLKDAQEFELAKAKFGEDKANNLFQQYLAEQELGLKKKDQTFQQWLATAQLGETTRSNLATEGLAQSQFLHNKNIDWANVHINQAQVEGTLAQVAKDAADAKDAKTKEAAKLRGDGIAKALEYLSSYLAPGKGEAQGSNSAYPFGPASQGAIADVAGDASTLKDNTTQYQRLFDDALRGMTQYTSRSDALRILMKSDYPDWRNRAKDLFNHLKRRRRPNSATNYPTKGGAGAGA